MGSGRDDDSRRSSSSSDSRSESEKPLLQPRLEDAPPSPLAEAMARDNQASPTQNPPASPSPGLTPISDSPSVAADAARKRATIEKIEAEAFQECFTKCFNISIYHWKYAPLDANQSIPKDENQGSLASEAKKFEDGIYSKEIDGHQFHFKLENNSVTRVGYSEDEYKQGFYKYNGWREATSDQMALMVAATGYKELKIGWEPPDKLEDIKLEHMIKEAKRLGVAVEFDQSVKQYLDKHPNKREKFDEMKKDCNENQPKMLAAWGYAEKLAEKCEKYITPITEQITPEAYKSRLDSGSHPRATPNDLLTEVRDVEDRYKLLQYFTQVTTVKPTPTRTDLIENERQNLDTMMNVLKPRLVPTAVDSLPPTTDPKTKEAFRQQIEQAKQNVDQMKSGLITRAQVEAIEAKIQPSPRLRG